MPLFKTSNPALGENVFRNTGGQYGGYGAIDAAARMTVSGTVNKTALLLLCALGTAAWTWNDFLQNRDISEVGGRLMIGIIGGLIFSLVTIFKKEWSAVTAPAYALLEGMALGGISAFFEMRFPGIAIQAVGLTFGTLLAMLLVYRTGLIKVTQRFRLGVVAATGGIALFYFALMLLNLFGIHFYSIYGGGPIGIVISLVVVAVAALNLVLDFDFIERGAASGAPKYMEWYSAFGLMLTLVWLYLEMLRLLSKFNSRR
jgi:uncharacterized YccA/Bax inhibitor family protein